MSGIKRAISNIKTKTRNMILRKKVMEQIDKDFVEEEKEEEKQKEPGFLGRYELGKELGHGNFSVVRTATDKQTGKTVAVKCMNGAKLRTKDVTALQLEVNLLKQLDHPGIIKLHGYFQVNGNHFIVTEYVAGGELFDRIIEKEYYSEKDAQEAVRSIAEALKYCHDHNIVHRDLKPENLLLVDKNSDTRIKLADFGFAKEVTKESELNTACGTPGYVAPEIICGKQYGKEVDMWSLGVIIYILLCGYPPFYDETPRAMMLKIKEAKYTFDPEWWSSVSEIGRSVVRSLLLADPNKRMTIDGLLDHPWLKTQDLYDRDITPVIAGITNYQARRRLRAGQAAVHAVTRMQRLSITNIPSLSDSNN